MRTSILAAVSLALATFVATPSAFADEAAVYQKLIKDKANTIVSVKFVLNVKITQNGAPVAPPREQAGNASGVVVDNSGLVMIPGSAFGAGGIPRQLRRRFDISAVPSNIRVVFPGDTREYNAVLGAKDSKLGLAFVLVKDLGEKKIQALDMATYVEPKLGQRLYGVTRLDQGFDHAPMAIRMSIAGSVTKPRSMWIIQGAGNQIGKPAYDAAGAVAGIIVSQEGVGEDSVIRPFLLSLKVAGPTVATALKKSKAELDRILEEEEEAAAEAADADPKKDETKKDEPKKDAPKDEGDAKMPKEEAPKKETPKKDAPKEEGPKKDDGKQDGE